MYRFITELDRHDVALGGEQCVNINLLTDQLSHTQSPPDILFAPDSSFKFTSGSQFSVVM